VTTYEPVETRAWSTRELAALIDKKVTVSFGGADHSGLVTDAGIGYFGQAWITFAGGGSVAYSRDEISTTITVED
jgi:hypothetical protein